MKSINFSFMKIALGMTGTVAGILLCAGCTSAPAAPTVAQQQQSIETRIQTIQNDPKLSPESKQNAIASLKRQ